MKSIWICITCFSLILSLCIGKDDERTESSDENEFDELSVEDRRRIRRQPCKVGKQNGTCTIIAGCQHYLNLITSKERLEYKSFVDQATNACVQKRRNPLVCCPLGDQPYQLTILNTSNKTDTEIAPTPVTEASVNSVIPEPGVCGVSSGSMPRIVNGTRAKFGQLPWMAAIGVKEPKIVDKWFCGGFLVTNRHVISAAHCNEDTTPDLVRLGDLELEDEDDNAEPVDVAITHFLPHPKFDKKTLDNDIALLTLDRDVAFTDRIRPICIPWNAVAWRKLDFGKFKPYIAGWGSTETFAFDSDKKLRIAQLGIINNNDCRDRYQIDDGNKPLLDNSKICALETGKDACQGDSGGPLMVERAVALPHIKKVYFAIGVISFGKYCADIYPGVYTRLDHYVDWLEYQLQNKNTSPKKYKMNLPRRKIESALESVSFIIDYVSKNDLTNDKKSTKMLNNLQQWKDRMKKKLEE